MKQLTIEEFSNVLKNRLREYLPNVNLDRITLNCRERSSALQPLFIKGPHATTTTSLPLMYLDAYYTRYKGGESIENILDHISQNVENAVQIEEIKPYLHRRKARHLIAGRFINVQDREDEPRLMERPVTTFPGSDIGVIYDLCLPDSVAGESVSIPITFEIMAAWCYTPDMLYKMALRNAPHLRPGTIRTVGNMLRDYGYNEHATVGCDDMVIIGNTACEYGAFTITYPGVDMQIRSLLGDYYLLPSSVHQLMAVSKSHSPATLAQIIMSINNELLDYEDILGSVPYEYKDGHIYPVDVTPCESIPDGDFDTLE